MKKSRSVRRINKFIPIHNDYMGMYWFIRTEGLYEKILNFYDDFSLEKIDEYKQKERKKNE